MGDSLLAPDPGGKGQSNAFREKQIADMKKTMLDQSLETIRNRVDQFGVT